MDKRSIKCVIVGDGMVGKTCLVLSYTLGDKGGFGDYIPTVADKFAAEVTVGNTPVIFNLWDTGVNDETSLVNVKDVWIPEITQHCPDAAVILVGTKADTRLTARNPNEILRGHMVSYYMGKKMAKKLKVGYYVECSAKTGEGVKCVFDMAIKAGLDPEKFKRKHGCNTM